MIIHVAQKFKLIDSCHYREKKFDYAYFLAYVVNQLQTWPLGRQFIQQSSSF